MNKFASELAERQRKEHLEQHQQWKEEIPKLWNAHEEVLLYLDEHVTAIKNLAEALGDVATEIGQKTPQYEFKQIYKELEELQGKLEYTFSKVQELKQKSTPKEEQEDYL